MLIYFSLGPLRQYVTALMTAIGVAEGEGVAKAVGVLRTVIGVLDAFQKPALSARQP